MTPEQEDDVRRALASAPPTGPIPPEVVARLDSALADLVAERAGEPPATGPDASGVVSLEERRRRRWPRVLVAAASVSVLAYGVGITLDGLQVSGGDAASTAARDETVSREDAAGGLAGPAESAGTSDPERADGVDGGSTAGGRLLSARTVRLHRATLSDDVRSLLVRPVRDLRSTADTHKARGFLARCGVPDTARGDRLAAAVLDGTRGTLVVRKAVSGTHVAEVYSCDDASRLLALTQVRTVR